MRIHLIRGYSLHGKTTYAQHLSQELELPIFSFATYLKNQVKHYFTEMGASEEIFDLFKKDQILPEEFTNLNCKTLRDYYKQFALKYKRDNPYFYAEKLFELANSLGYYEIIIDDFRFPEEYEYLSSFPENQFLFYRVVDLNGIIPDPEDRSEHSLDDIDFKDEKVIYR